MTQRTVKDGGQIPPASNKTAESEKAAREQRIFLEFVRLSELPIDPGSIESRRPPEPDIRCLVAGVPVAFEIVELRIRALAKNVSDQNKHGAPSQLVAAGDEIREIFQSKVRKSYRSDAPIELVCYHATVWPHRVALEKLRQAAAEFGHGPFRRVWFLGDLVHIVAAAST